MNIPFHLLIGAFLGLPALAAGFAFTAATPDGILPNQTAGQPIIWNNPQQSFVFNFNADSGDIDFNASAVSAMNEWNMVNASLQYQLGTTNAKTCAADNFNSGGWGTVTCSGKSFGDALAVTRRSFHKIGETWYLSDADIVLDQTRNWQLYSGPQRNGVQDFHRVILHELGHALGLDHPDEAGQKVTAIMNSHTSEIETLQADDKRGIKSLYSGGGISNSANQAAGEGGGGGGLGFTLTLLALAALATRHRSC